MSIPSHSAGAAAPPLTPAGRGGLLEAARRSIALLVFGLLPAALLAAFLAGSAGHHPAYDFRALWNAGNDVLAGRSPYPSVHELRALRGTAIDEFVYPAVVAVAAVPFAALPFGAAAAVWMGLLVAATGLALRLVGVRDWRCYGALLASPATLDAIRLGTLTPVLLLLAAAAWRWRDSAWRCGLALAAAVAAKVFLAPLLVWLLATRRYRAAAVAAGGAGALMAAGWAAIGLAGLHGYPRLLSTLSDVEAARSYSTAALAAALGAGLPGLAATAGASGLGALGIVGLARRRGDLAAFAGALGLALLVTPILWLHYLLLAGLVVAVRRPAFGAVWLAGWAMWASPGPESGGEPWRIALGLAVIAVAVGVASRPAPRTA